MLLTCACNFTMLHAQGFSIDGTCNSLRGKIDLIIHEDNEIHYISTINNGTFAFKGAVKSPVVAEIRHRHLSQPLFFYLENTNIKINLSEETPANSPITGSRSNSEYRIYAETAMQAIEGHGDLQRVTDEKTIRYLPHVLYDCASQMDFNRLTAIYETIDSSAFDTYHYKQLKHLIERMQAVQEGAKMVDFVFYEQPKKPQHFDSIPVQKDYRVVYFGAKWCDKCKEVLQMGAQIANTEWIEIMIDNDPKEWDADYLDLLAIDHIPFLILLDKENKIISRDVRVWQLPRLIKP